MLRSLLAEVPPWSIAVPPAACVLLAVVVGRSPG